MNEPTFPNRSPEEQWRFDALLRHLKLRLYVAPVGSQTEAITGGKEDA